MAEQPVEIRTPFVLDFSGNDHKAGDFRPRVESADAVEEELDPKDLSVPEPAASSDSGQIALEFPEGTASVEKVSTPPKENGPGTLALPPVISAGKTEQPVAR